MRLVAVRRSNNVASKGDIMNRGLAFVVILLGAGLAHAQQPASLVEVRKIWDRAPTMHSPT